MVTDHQVRTLYTAMKTSSTLAEAADKAGMDRKTARKYLKFGKFPSELARMHDWRTRPDPFEDVWPSIREKLNLNPGLQAKTFFDDLQRQSPGVFQNGQLRTLQRRIKQWRALEGPPKEVYFPQEHHPGELAASDFTDMRSLQITISGQPFSHLVYHFVLTYSNWQTGTICYTESFESLSEGLQQALWTLGGVPTYHRTDRMSAAVHQDLHKERFTVRYRELLSHYRLQPNAINAKRPNENGDVEQSHYRFKQALDQSLMLRGSRDFPTTADYHAYLLRLFDQLNSGCSKRFSEEKKTLSSLPIRRLDTTKVLKVTVGPSSTIRIYRNVYSVDSRLIGETVQARLKSDHVEIWYASRHVDTLPRLRGDNGHRIEYRHIIDWLVRKPGAFENYRYRQDLYPTYRFRIAYDQIKRRMNGQSAKTYLQILQLAAKENQDLVDRALGHLIHTGTRITPEAVEALVRGDRQIKPVTEVRIDPVELSQYDQLLGQHEEVATW